MNEKIKETEVGLIPDEWDIATLNEVCKLINGRGFKPNEWRAEGIPIIRIQNLNGSEDYNYYQGTYDKKIEVEKHQLLFAWSGSRGTSFGPHLWNNIKGLLNYHTWKIIVYEQKVNKMFFFYSLKKLTRQIEEKAHGASALVHTQKWEMEKYPIPLPRTIAEQEAIATVLSDTDAWIESLEAQIEKKKLIKQGTMQELLTGKRRLPGFGAGKDWKDSEVGQIPVDWEVKRLGDIISENPKYGINAPAIEHDDRYFNYLRITDIDENGRINLKNLSSVAHPFSRNYILKNNEIVFARTGASVGKSYIHSDKNGTYVYAGFLIKININTNIANPHLIFLHLHTKNYKDWIETNSARSGQPGINGNQIKEFSFPLSNIIDEQEAIAKVLSEMDDEIKALEQKVEKAKGIKQGLMQVLLTGKIRLV
ncbi:restriction endonuclease subunit S [Leptospira paudalimensis]|uniref:Restriction endonuclease subunit S n=1 Tax=Leptospira paudalimensis TaxID=2950024 RepID=A0ABT3M684_9LEPT|nr:restriction endonuclease subunit S [Leptospira paudalimensis]MCW7503900.1 restriction endonuclease subunit S [Leptospira paudalimensis]